MKKLFLTVCLFATLTLPAQVISLDGGTTTRAVVIGISDYQDSHIPDLRFADKDAEAFANFLRSPAGGSLDGDHLKLLTNHQATAAQFAAALAWLIDETKEDDKVIIYFSGHGDVEKKTLTQPGYLLCWDTPSRVYMAGGAFNLRDIQEVISTLSIQNKARVIVLADACHSGKLSGSAIGGPQATATNLSKQYANEIKILSCQPNEFSVEGEQWGGGRGAFSYHLLNGLYGMADANQDGGVNLFEIGRYLEDHVSSEVAPIKQLPLIVGDRSEAIAQVVPSALAEIQKNQQSQGPVLSKTETHGLEEQVLEDLDEGTRAQYFSFQKALLEKRFLEPSNDCAEAYFGPLLKEPKLASLHASIRRNYAAALQDEAQQAVNAILEVNVQALTRSVQEQVLLYQRTPSLLARSAELLGEQHYMYATLKARQLLFEGMYQYVVRYSSKEPEVWEAVMENFRQSLHYEPESPLAHFYMSLCFASQMNQADSAYFHAMEAIRHAETWVLPYTYLAFYYAKDSKRFDEAKTLLDKAMLLDSGNVYVWMGWGSWHNYQKQYTQAIEAFKHALWIEPENPVAWTNLGVAYQQDGQNQLAEKAFHQALRLDSTLFVACLALGRMYAMTNRPVKGEQMYLRAITLNPTNINPHRGLAILYLEQDRLPEAEAHYLEVVKYNAADSNIWYKLALLAALDNRQQQSFERLEIALEKGMRDYQKIMDDTELEPVRKMAAFKGLMEKYFPNQEKD
ncbi:MAG: tetratricopeptide repeat protein [Saprospiraceae bacterium]|nr:tetratricopeptide repeat protein [Saprospiraceae bacterium]